MLGKKRNKTVFLKEENQQNVGFENENSIENGIIINESIDKTVKDSHKHMRELGSEKRTHSLFFTPESEGRDFFTVLKDVQEYISSNYSILITDGTVKDSKEHLKRYISKYIQDSRISVKGMNSEELIDALYSEMAEFGFLTKYIYGKGIEEIDINSWKDIEIQYSDGRCEKLGEHFDSPEHAINVIRRMLHISGMVLDNASPAVLGHLSKIFVLQY